MRKTKRGRGYINPDVVFLVEDSVVFAFNNKLQRLFYIDCPFATHADLVDEYPNYLSEEDREDYTGDVLWGRLGPYSSRKLIVISFWNDEDINNPVWRHLDTALFDLQGLVDRLVYKYPQYKVVVCAPAFMTVPLSEIGSVLKKPSMKVDKEKMEYYKRLHQARGQEKKELMKKLGLGFDPEYDPHPWHTAAKRMSYKYSLPSPWGESFEDEITTVLNGARSQLFEDYDDYVEISGEYWIIDGTLLYADGDIGDKNHEAFAIDHVLSSVADDLRDLANKLGIESEDLYGYGEVDFDKVENLAQVICNYYKSKGEKRPASKMERELKCNEGVVDILLGHGDARQYVMDYEGWIAVRGNNVELTGYDQSKQDVLVAGLDEILEVEGLYDVDDSEVELSIYDHNTGRHWYATLEELKSPTVPFKGTQPATTKRAMPSKSDEENKYHFPSNYDVSKKTWKSELKKLGYTYPPYSESRFSDVVDRIALNATLLETRIDDLPNVVLQSIIYVVGGDWKFAKKPVNDVPSLRYQWRYVCEVEGRDVRYDGDRFYLKLYIECFKKPEWVNKIPETPSGYHGGSDWWGPSNSPEFYRKMMQFGEPYEKVRDYDPKKGHPLIRFAGLLEGWRPGMMPASEIDWETSAHLKGYPIPFYRKDSFRYAMVRIGSFCDESYKQESQFDGRLHTPFEVAKFVKEAIDEFYRDDGDDDDDDDKEDLPPSVSGSGSFVLQRV